MLMNPPVLNIVGSGRIVPALETGEVLPEEMLTVGRLGTDGSSLF